MSEGIRERIDVQGGNKCPYCHEQVLPSQSKLPCDACMAWHHTECWEAHGTCAACGADAPIRLQPTPRRPPRRPSTAHPTRRCGRQGCGEPARLGYSLCDEHTQAIMARYPGGQEIVDPTGILVFLGILAALLCLLAYVLS